MLSRLDTVPERDRRTYRRTDRIAISISRVSIVDLLHDNTALLGEFNPLMGTSKLHSNGSLFNNTVIGTLAAVAFGTARRDLGKLRPRPVPSSQYQM